MEADKVDKFLLANESKFPDYEIPIHRLLDLPPEKEAILAKNHFKSPICMLSVSCFLGYFGLDRFLIGDWGSLNCSQAVVWESGTSSTGS